MSMGRNTILVGLLATTIIATSCDETPSDPSTDGPSVPGIASEVEVPGLIVSLSRALTSNTGLAFVSLEPGSIEGGREAILANSASAAEVRVSIVDGGFDPVAVKAAHGDMLSVEIVGPGVLSPPPISLFPIPYIPPVVVRTDPPKRRTSVPLNALMVVVFSEPINPASVGSGSIRLLNSRGSVDVDFVLRDEGTVVEIRPKTSLLPSTDYILEIGTAIEDLGGEHLVDPVLVDFQTEPCDLGDEPFAVRLLPDTLRLPVGSYSGFVVAVDSGARVINTFPDPSLTWGTTDPAVVSVDFGGGVEGVTIGEAYVIVEYEGDVDSALVIVTKSPPPGPFRVFPDGATVPVGATLQFDVSHPEGTERPTVTWTTTDPAIFVVDEDGLVTTGGAGRAYLVATAGADVDSADIDVFEVVDPLASEWDVSQGLILLEVGSSYQLELVPTNPSESSPPPFRWSSEDASIASVDAAGLVRGVSPGKTGIAAVFEDGSGSVALVEVFEVGGLPQISLNPSEVTLLPGEFVTFEVVRDSAATAIYGNTSPAWGFSSVGVGEVLRFHPESRSFEAIGPGVAHVTAEFGMLSAQARVTVEE